MSNQMEGANLPSTVYQILQIRKPFMPSSMTALVTTWYFSRFVTTRISFRARFGFKQGMKKDVPRLKFFQLML